MLSRAHTPLQAVSEPAPPVEQLLLGRPVEEAANMLPRIFNLCRTAQEVAARLAFGLTLQDGWENRLAWDVARDHALKLMVLLPTQIGFAPVTPPADFAALPNALFGTDGIPTDVERFEDFLTRDVGVAPLLREVDHVFGPGEGISSGLPLVGPDTAGQICPVENSVAGRHHDSFLMQHLERTRGRGPLWRLWGRVLDVIAAINGHLPAPRHYEGSVLVPAARGLYALRAHAEDGRVASFARVTPTDHLLSERGMAEQALATLPKSKRAFAPLLLDILDPCVPVTLRGGSGNA